MSVFACLCSAQAKIAGHRITQQSLLAAKGSGLAFHPSLLSTFAASDQSFQSIFHAAPWYRRKAAHCQGASLLHRIYTSTQKLLGIHKSREIGRKKKSLNQTNALLFANLTSNFCYQPNSETAIKNTISFICVLLQIFLMYLTKISHTQSVVWINPVIKSIC